MPETPEPVRKLDSFFSASLIAHEAIFEMRRELVATGRGGREPTALLEESARVTVTDLPSITRRARRLAARWDEQGLLDPEVAGTTIHALAAKLDRIGPQVGSLLERQRQIAARLRSMVDP